MSYTSSIFTEGDSLRKTKDGIKKIDSKVCIDYLNILYEHYSYGCFSIVMSIIFIIPLIIVAILILIYRIGAFYYFLFATIWIMFSCCLFLTIGIKIEDHLKNKHMIINTAHKPIVYTDGF